jgi:hypothetical protein
MESRPDGKVLVGASLCSNAFNLKNVALLELTRIRWVINGHSTKKLNALVSDLTATSRKESDQHWVERFAAFTAPKAVHELPQINFLQCANNELLQGRRMNARAKVDALWAKDFQIGQKPSKFDDWGVIWWTGMMIETVRLVKDEAENWI